MLRRQFQSAVGLHDTITVGNRSSTVSASARMVQIFHDAANKHWLTVSTVHCPANYANILCSLQRTPSNACIRAITAYCKFTGPYVTLRILNVCRQRGGSDCGLYAVAYQFMWCVPPRRRHQLPDEPLPVSNLNVEPVSSVRDLGVYLDTDMSMNTHITQLVCTCFGILRQIRCIRRSLPRSSLATLITAFMLSKVDYCKVVLSGLPKRDLSEYSLLSMLLLVFRLERANTTTSCRC